MLSGAHTWSLTAIAVAVGAAALWVMRLSANQDRIRLARRKMRAHLYEFRLFPDEPRLILRAQMQLLAWNGRYLTAMLVPAIAIAAPTVWLLIRMDAIYGHRPLRAGETAIVTARFSPGTDLGSVAPRLDANGAAVETPAVRIPGRQEACWRVRALAGSIRLRVAAGPGSVRRVEIAYPRASIDLFGWGIDWLVWFCAVSFATMVVLRGRFNVAF